MYAYEMVVGVLQGGELFVDGGFKGNTWLSKPLVHNLSRRPHGVGPWKNIRKLWCEFSLSSSFKLGIVPTFNSGKTNG